MANTTYNTVTVTTSATRIVAASSNRKGLILANEGSVKVFIGPDDSITTSNAIPLFQSEKLFNSGLPDLWRGDIYGIVASGTADIRYWEYGQ